MKDTAKRLELPAAICRYMCAVYKDCGNHTEALLSGNEAMKFYRQAVENDNHGYLVATPISSYNEHD